MGSLLGSRLERTQMIESRHVSLSQFFKIFWPYHGSCGILVLPPGVIFLPPALQAHNLNHWTTRKVLSQFFFFFCPSFKKDFSLIACKWQHLNLVCLGNSYMKQLKSRLCSAFVGELNEIVI